MRNTFMERSRVYIIAVLIILALVAGLIFIVPSSLISANALQDEFAVNDEIDTMYFDTQLTVAEVVGILEELELAESMDPYIFMTQNVDTYIGLPYLVAFFVEDTYMLAIADGDIPVFVFSSDAITIGDIVLTLGWQNLDSNGSYTFADTGTVTGIYDSALWNGTIASPSAFI